MPHHAIITTLPSSPHSRRHRRRLPSPAKAPAKPEDQPIPSITRHYPIPAIHPLPPSSSQNLSPGTHTSPFPTALPSMRNDTAVETTHTSQDELTEEVWGPRVTLEPLKKKHKKHKPSSKSKSKSKNKEGDIDAHHLKMCPTNGYQPRKGSAAGEGMKMKCDVSGSTEFVTTYQVERLVGGGRRKTWVTWSRQRTVREERVVDGEGVVVVGGGGSEGEEESSEEGSSDGGERSGEGSEEKGKKGRKGEGEESSDEEYFDERRCEWRPKEELKGMKGRELVEEGEKGGKK